MDPKYGKELGPGLREAEEATRSPNIPEPELTWKLPLPNCGCCGGLACVCWGKPWLALPKGLNRVLNELRPLRNGWKNVSARNGERKGDVVR